MAILIPRTVRSILTSRLSRQLGLWVFVGILGVEAIIFLPSAYRRKYEQLDMISMTAQATINTLAIADPETAVFVDRLPKLKQNAPLLGAGLYSTDGKLINQFGSGTTFSFAQAQAQTTQLRYQSPWCYEIAIPVTLKDGPHYLLLAYDATLVAQDLAAFSLRILGLILLISISVTMMMMWIISRRLINPILQLRSDMYRSGEAIAAGQSVETFDSQQYQTQNELSEVIQAFHQTHRQIVAAIGERDRSEANLQQTADQLQVTLQNLQQTQAQLIHTEKMSSLGQLGAGFAHEINNPINFIDANLKHIHNYGQDLLTVIAQYQQEFPQPSVALQANIEDIDLDFIQQDMPSLVKSMQSGSTRIRDLVVSFRNFVRLDEADQKAVDLHEGLDSALLLLQSRLAATSTRPEILVQKHYGPLSPVQCHPKQLNQVFMNLITNAIEAIDKQTIDQRTATDTPPTIDITTAIEATAVVIQLTDNGIGIDPEIQSKIFDPFFTTKDVGQGMGLGLTNSYRIITEIHQGQLEFDPAFTPGTMFTIRLPQQDQRGNQSKSCATVS
jgi:two-component system, NtrC family, sensor kinase